MQETTKEIVPDFDDNKIDEKNSSSFQHERFLLFFVFRTRVSKETNKIVFNIAAE